MRLVTLTIALSLLIAAGCGTPVAATDASGDLAASACASECAGESACSDAEKAECAMDKSECAAKCEGADADAGTN